jgi:hypothetical protein
MLYLYAVADELARVDGCAGAAQEPLRAIAIESMTAVAGELAEPPAVVRATLEAQDQVVRCLHERASALLPMRFGTAYETEAEVRHAIATHAEGLRERLERVRGREQMTIRIVGGHPAPIATGASSASRPDALDAGTRYLRQRAAAAIPDDIRPLLDALRPLERATRVERGKATGVVATVYQLIDRGTSAAYRTAASQVAGSSRLSILISGPSPCYAFA